MTTLLLARHGSHDEVGRVLSGRSAIGLNAAGRAEAAALADRLARRPLSAIHSSPRPRALETAAIVAARHGLPIRVEDALDEIDFGGWTGLAFAALDRDPAWARWNRSRATALTPGGETMTAATARAVRHLATIEGEDTVLCVTHCDIIRGVVAHHLGLSADNLLRFACDPASLTTLAADGAGVRLVALNERAA